MINPDFINREEYLYIALHVSSELADPNDPVRIIADTMIIKYIVEEFMEKHNRWPDEDEIHHRSGELLADHILTKMVQEGKLDVIMGEDGEFKYKAVSMEEAESFARYMEERGKNS